jgi:hypothetical protein
MMYELLPGGRIFEHTSKERCSMTVIRPSSYGCYLVLFEKPGNIKTATMLSLLEECQAKAITQ